MIKVEKNPIYQTSEIIINSDGRVLNADNAFCEIFNCKNPETSYNSIILDEKYQPIVVNAFIDTFYSNHKGKLIEVKMLDFSGNKVDVSINFFLIKSSNGQKATLLIRKKLF